MGILGKIVSTASQLVTAKGTSEKITESVGHVITNKMNSKGEEQLKQIEIAFELKKQEYLRKREKLEQKAQWCPSTAKKSQNLDNEFKIVQIEYEGNKRVVLAKNPKLNEKYNADKKEPYIEKPLEIRAIKTKEASMSIKCEKCGHESPRGIKFCGNCGNAIVEKVFCTSCGYEVDSKLKFCPNCGERV